MKISEIIDRTGGRLFARYPGLVSLWAKRARVRSFSDIPWTPLEKPLRECAVALVTTAGVHEMSDRPFDMKDRRGDPSYREIPSDTPARRLMVTHDYYDHRDADRDVNVVFPLDRLREMVAEGEVGRPAPCFYSFMGHIEKPHIDELIGRTSVEVARKLAAAGVDLVLLSPA